MMYQGTELIVFTTSLKIFEKDLTVYLPISVIHYDIESRTMGELTGVI